MAMQARGELSAQIIETQLPPEKDIEKGNYILQEDGLKYYSLKTNRGLTR